MPNWRTNYSEDWYRDKRPATFRSAELVVPLVVNYVNPHSIIDLGCGTGEWLRVFMSHGVTTVLGVDGDHIDPGSLSIPATAFRSADLERPLHVTERTFDMAVALEVAEHLKQDSAATFVNTLTSVAPVVLFSAAVPYQGGTGHINEQWPSYWADLFAKEGFIPIDCLRERVWNERRIPIYYKQNLLFFVRAQNLQNYPGLAAVSNDARGSLDRVHPELYMKRAAPYALLMRGATLVPGVWRKRIIRRARAAMRFVRAIGIVPNDLAARRVSHEHPI